MDIVLGWLKELATGRRKKVFWAMVIILAIVVWAVYPFMDASFFVHNRIARRIDNLGNLIAIEDISTQSSSALAAEYDSIVREMEEARIVRDNGVFYRNDTDADFRMKFIGGALLGGILAIIGLFYNDGGTIGQIILTKLLIVVMGLLFGAALGFLFAMIPVIFSAWVNLILAPVVQIILIALLAE